MSDELDIVKESVTEVLLDLMTERVMSERGLSTGVKTSSMRGLLHIKNTHFDSVASVVITKVASVAFCSQGRKCHMFLISVASVKESMLL
jgi:hypothetical protein